MPGPEPATHGTERSGVPQPSDGARAPKPAPQVEDRGAPDPLAPGESVGRPGPEGGRRPAADGTFLKVRPEDHPLPGACEVTVYFQDYHRSSSKFGRFGKIVGMDLEVGEYLVMLDNFECVSAPMRRVEWRKVAT